MRPAVADVVWLRLRRLFFAWPSAWPHVLCTCACGRLRTEMLACPRRRREINRGGLLLIYQIVLQTAGADIVRTLELVLDAAESRRAQLFFCKLGEFPAQEVHV